jgi:hypothetical protein
MLCLFDFLLLSRHFSAGTAIGNGYPLCAKTECGSGCIDGCVAAPHHDHFFTDRDRFSQRNLSQEIDSMEDPLRLFSIEAKFSALVGACGDEDSLITSGLEVLKGKVWTNRRIELEFNAHAKKGINLFIENSSWQAIFRDPNSEHPSSHR